MKTKLLLPVLLCATFLSFSQTIWTGGGSDINWNNSDNWSTNMVPSITDDVEIPGGFTVTIGGAASCESLELKGNAILNIDSGNGLFSTQPSLFEAGTTVNWARGTINCSLLVNQGTINLTSSADKLFETSTLVNNNGSINIIGSGNLFLRDGTVLNNQIDGTIDMGADDGNIDNLGGLPILNNAGIIRRSTSAGEAQIRTVELNNNGGIIQVDSGTLSLIGFGDKNFMGGTYVVSSGAVLEWDTSVIASGLLMGTIEGDLNWKNTLSVPDSAVLNFTGGGNFNWINGALNGGGTLTNQSILNLTTTSSKSIQENTTMNNSGTINIADTGDLRIQNGSILNNVVSGVIDLQTDGGNIVGSGGGSNILNNTGIIKRTITTGEAKIDVELNNSGTIEVETGELEIGNTQPFTNAINGIIKGVGVFDLPIAANYTNDGVFAPGASPGTLSIQGDFKSTTNSILDIELNGLTQGTEYDLLAITGNADFEGSIQITLGFNPDVNDEFIIATTTNTINTCNLPPAVISSFGGLNYEFGVVCRNNNELVLTVANETLGIDSINENESTVRLYPNPASDIVSFSDITIKKITVFDINGKEMLSDSSNYISVKTLSNGIYIVKGTNDNGFSISKKLIKN